MQICNECKEIYDLTDFTGVHTSRSSCPKSLCKGHIIDVPDNMMKSVYNLLSRGYSVNCTFDMKGYSRAMIMGFSINSISEGFNYPNIETNIILTTKNFHEEKNFELIKPCFNILKDDFLDPIYNCKNADLTVYFCRDSITFTIQFHAFKYLVDINNMNITTSPMQIFQSFLNYKDKCREIIEEYTENLPSIDHIVKSKEE